jgi:hypothetical protein
MLVLETSCGDSRPRLSGRVQFDLQRPAFTKPLHFFTKLYATFLVHLGLHPQESK